MITPEQLAEFIDHYGVLASTMFAVPVDRDELKELVYTLSAALKVVEVTQEYLKEMSNPCPDPVLRRTLREAMWKALEPFDEGKEKA